MFEKGDLILYGATGVCRIADIAPRAGGEEDQLYYTIRPLRQECVIYAPVESDKVYMRPILTREEAEQLIDTIPHTDAHPFQSRVVRELSDHYGAAIRSHDCAQLLKLTMSIWKKRENARQNRQKLGAVDEKFMKRAQELLFDELSAALGIEEEAVPDYIASRVGAGMPEEALEDEA